VVFGMRFGGTSGMLLNEERETITFTFYHGQR